MDELDKLALEEANAGVETPGVCGGVFVLLLPRPLLLDLFLAGVSCCALAASSLRDAIFENFVCVCVCVVVEQSLLKKQNMANISKKKNRK